MKSIKLLMPRLVKGEEEYIREEVRGQEDAIQCNKSFVMLIAGRRE